MYKNGNVPSGDRTQAAYWLQKAAEQNHTSAHLDLGLLYESDRETEKDPAQAVYWYRRGAELGHGGCQYNLARCLWYGIGTQADHQQALLWCRRAAAARSLSSPNGKGKQARFTLILRPNPRQEGIRRHPRRTARRTVWC